MNIYENCPSIENEEFLVRLIKATDENDLHKVYADKSAIPFFNKDNCDDDFYYPTKELIHKAMLFWLSCYYDYKCFVRLSIVSKRINQAIGTFEIFSTDETSPFGPSCFLRLDLRSDFEKQELIENLMQLVIPFFRDILNTKRIVTKNFEASYERSKAFVNLGFVKTDIVINGKDGTKLGSYIILDR